MQIMEPIGPAEQILEENRLFVYPYETHQIFTAADRNWARKGLSIPRAFRDLFCISAAEFALVRQAYTDRFPKLELPIKVLPQDAKLALLKADTTLSDPCSDTLDRVKNKNLCADDVFLFAGDSLKFARFAKEELTSFSRLSDAMSYYDELDKYQRDDFFYPLLKDLFDSPLICIENILWKLQVDILILTREKEEISADVSSIKKGLISRYSSFLA